ncbi:PepSY domain-containing protein [Streptomyces sp. NPDC006367]|uniref:PepSY domain-containing protein n=1 Tax=unclassified Streptomyces TaxID=2593676 RepID=UPI0033AF7F35
MSSARRLPPMRSMAVLCALGSSVLLMTACTNADTTRSSVAEAAPTGSPSGSASVSESASPTSASPTSPSLNEDEADRKALVPLAKVTWDKAADTAVKEVSGGKLVDLELKRTSSEATASPTGSPMPSTPNAAPSAGAPEWEAKVAASDGTVHRVDIDAVSGKVFRTQVDDDQDADDKKKTADLLKKATQTPQQAVKAATDKTKGTVTHVELGDKDQKAVWAVDVVSTDTWDKTTVDVDATNGKILREHVDRD